MESIFRKIPFQLQYMNLEYAVDQVPYISGSSRQCAARMTIHRIPVMSRLPSTRLASLHWEKFANPVKKSDGVN